MITRLRVFEGGYCRQLLALIDRRSWLFEKFQARYLALYHESRGWLLVDTGYGSEFASRVRGWPFGLYRLATPVTPLSSVRDQLAAAGIDGNSIRDVVITHFHGDHIGGLHEFPKADYHFAEEALSALLPISSWKQVHSAFVPELVPQSLRQNPRGVPFNAFRKTDDLPFLTHDVFGDGSVSLVWLPGHAPGHVGVAFSLAGKKILYAADAFWRRCQITDSVRPSGLALGFQWDRGAYERTIDQLREVHRIGVVRLAACHDSECLQNLRE
ncbi:MBL fold metallo-hydrolase [Nibricoccus sp. IMCC34717]|uniref:MBL fold metallo-hydrolase n=1 Tax=Nibricoccus sp. IMCC34717 TaxID=3034021 RepID=UPI003850CD5A